VLRAAEGAQNREIARELGTNPTTVALWRRRFLMQGIPGLARDAPRPGRPPAIPTSTIQVILRTTLGRKPPEAAYWSARRLAHTVGVSKTTVQRVWKAHHIQPRRAVESFRPNPGAKFVEKVTDFVGLYLYPPERAMVFTVDENAQGSALARAERRAIDEFQERSRATEFRAFLQTIDRETPKELDLHLLVDNRLAPTAPEVRRWLVRHPRFYLHYLPSDGGGPNLIDRWLGEFTKKRVRSTTFPSVARLHRAIRTHFGGFGAGERPFVWVASSEEIRERRGRNRLPQ
jgi:homeodomain-containing protein/DDE superfamily endonuclease